jgi:hypothetical protein
MTTLTTQPPTSIAQARTRPEVSPTLRMAWILTLPIALLAGVAAAAGLFLPGLYREPPAFVPVLQAQDLVTLVAVPILIGALVAAWRGSARATLVWVGLLGYVFYTYTGAAFAYFFNDFFLIYIALFSLSVFALVAAAAGLDVAALRRRFDGAEPRRAVAAFLVLIALMLGALELRENIQFLATDTLPTIITNSGGVTSFVYVLDLGIIAPLAVLSAVWLWRRAPWGYVLAGFLLIKGVAMGLALLAMDGFSLRAGQPTDGLEIMWAVIAFGSLGMATWFLRHCRGGEARE